ncbi:MAG: Hemoglobin-like protein HbO [uncultured Sulfurovum sp.]|uniref:Hemoglobin-like protein HbO n=1 Tax=uncultured Sulfurovum sp. TaxID=269237 RepID=A0A6S6SSL5_9BACT|nr:MAG: Hemoglobin-like protein HbO [uncultured Sulfurovum sp.]
MNYSIIPHNANYVPQVQKPNATFLAQVGEQGIRDLLSRFYVCLDQSAIRDIFPAKDAAEMEKAAQTSADFFIQICGGPAYFNQRHGMPKMRQRHMPFTITAEGRLHWLICFENALQPLESSVKEEDLQSFWDYLNTFSIMMINAHG